MNFEFKELELKGAYLISNYYAGDSRGGFTKSFEKDIYKGAGIEFQLNETFASRSMRNVIRGLHFQTRNPQAKLVSVVAGRVWDVIVDLRPNSPTYKKWISQELSADNHLSFYVPRGFAHVMLYQCDGKYDAETDTGIIFNDPEIGIDWPIEENVAIHSTRDMKLQSFQEYLKNPMETGGIAKEQYLCLFQLHTNTKEGVRHEERDYNRSNRFYWKLAHAGINK